MFNKAAAADIEGLQVTSFVLGTLVTNKIRFIHDHSFEHDTVRGTKGGITSDTTITKDEIPRSLCGKALPKWLAELTGLKVKLPNKRILLIIYNSFEGRNFGRISIRSRAVVETGKAQHFCNVL